VPPLGIARNTVNGYIQAFKANDHTLKELLACDKAVLEALFTSHTPIDNQGFDQLTRCFERMNKARDHPGFSFLHHYQEDAQQVDYPYGHTQFMEHCHRKYAKAKGSMKLEHGPGHALFIDFAGKKLHIVDRDTGEVVPVEVFVAILPNCHYTYVEACRSQKREDLIKCCANALQFYGGVSKWIGRSRPFHFIWEGMAPAEYWDNFKE